MWNHWLKLLYGEVDFTDWPPLIVTLFCYGSPHIRKHTFLLTIDLILFKQQPKSNADITMLSARQFVSPHLWLCHDVDKHYWAFMGRIYRSPDSFLKKPAIRYFLCGFIEYAVQKGELSVIWDAIKLMWRHCQVWFNLSNPSTSSLFIGKCGCGINEGGLFCTMWLAEQDYISIQW